MLGEPCKWQFGTQLVSVCFVAEQAEVPGAWLADVLSTHKMSCKNKAGSGWWKSKSNYYSETWNVWNIAGNEKYF